MSSVNHEHYYVPAQSRLPVWMAFAMFLTVFGLGHTLKDVHAGVAGSNWPWVLVAGLGVMAIVLFNWFSQVIRENHAGLNSAQLKHSYVWGMGWFIFSEVMFFAAFFGALFYVRALVGPWIGGEGGRGATAYLYPDFQFTWPLLNNPDNSVFHAPEAVIHAFGVPLLNTILLVSSSVTITIAHHALRAEKRTALKAWLGVTIALGLMFLFFQATEYHEAYAELGLTLNSGIYGSTFFILTGFHGAHVTIGTLMLSVQLLRAFRGHFKPNDHFGFEAAAWYWHFVDVVWLCLFVLVYWL